MWARAGSQIPPSRAGSSPTLGTLVPACSHCGLSSGFCCRSVPFPLPMGWGPQTLSLALGLGLWEGRGGVYPAVPPTDNSPVGSLEEAIRCLGLFYYFYFFPIYFYFFFKFFFKVGDSQILLHFFLFIIFFSFSLSFHFL